MSFEISAPFRVLYGLGRCLSACREYMLLILLCAACTPPVPPAQPTPSFTWTPVYQTFDGVEMALVPAGCFTMGAEDADVDETPAQEICFDAPYWIDRTEVTNAQYGSAGAQAGDAYPRDTVDWVAAVVHCAVRGGRLPTEAEWEYAARGPDNWTYPWGNAFDPSRLVYEGNSGYVSAPVGSRPSGASWVGALDMSGNVWEWTASLYAAYPYRADDGRNDNEPFGWRVVRGGSWSSDHWHARALNRASFAMDHPDPNVGFRCVRDD